MAPDGLPPAPRLTPLPRACRAVARPGRGVPEAAGADRSRHLRGRRVRSRVRRGNVPFLARPRGRQPRGVPGVRDAFRLLPGHMGTEKLVGLYEGTGEGGEVAEAARGRHPARG